MANVKPPAGIEQPGRKLWAQIMRSRVRTNERGENFELVFDDRELALLELACHQADDLARLEREIKKIGAMVTGSTGQPVVNPAIAEARQARQSIRTLLAQVEFPDDDGQPRSAASDRARRAANARHRRKRAYG